MFRPQNNRCLRNPIYTTLEDVEFVNGKVGGPQHKHSAIIVMVAPCINNIKHFIVQLMYSIV